MRTLPTLIKSKLDWLLLPLILIPRLLNLDLFLTADEPLFFKHAQQFAAGVTSGNFSQTLGIGYPGVTVAGWAAPVVGLPSSELGAYAAGRVVTALLTGLLLLLLYSLSKRLLGRGPAFIGVGLLALDPYTLGYSRLLHIAAPLALLMTLTGLSVLLWLRQLHLRWVLSAGLFSGLALLTKSTALLLGPMLGLVVLGWGLSTGLWRQGHWWLQTIGGLVTASLVASLVFFSLWPAMWIDPLGALDLTFGKLLNDQEAGTGNLGMFWLGQFVQDPGPLFYPVAFLLKATPWLLVGLILNVACCVLRIPFFSRLTSTTKSKPETSNPPVPARGKPKTRLSPPGGNPKPAIHNTQRALRSQFTIHNSQLLWLFTLTYLVIMTIASKKSIRYMLPTFPAFYLLAGIAYHQTIPFLIKFFHQQFPISQSPILNLPISQSPNLLKILALIILLTFTLFYHPYYLTYYNPLVLGWRWAPSTLLVGWGEGLDVAARYLNEQPAGRVSAWYEWLFPIMYHGQVEPVVPQENLITAEHSLLYINQVQRDIPSPNVIHYFRTRRQPEYTVTLAGIDYAWLYPGPIAGFRPDPSPQVSFLPPGQFGDEARLLGYDLHPHPPVAGGKALFVTLYWRALATPSTDRFVYLRLVDEQGHIWARADSPPVMGLWPSTRWQPEMLIEDAHELPIAPGTPPGTYRLEVGLYDPDSGQPLSAEGQPLGQGGGLLLGEVAVEWQSAPTAAPELPRRAEVALAPNVQLVGYDSPPATATTGDIFPLRLAWRETGSWFQTEQLSNPALVFEWLSEGVTQGQQQTGLPLPVEEWGRGAVLLSQPDILVPPQLRTGRYNLQVSLQADDQPTGDPFSLGTVAVTAPSHQFDLPADIAAPVGSNQLSAEFGQSVTLAGYRYEVADNGLTLQLYWQTDAPLATRYKVFAQLLAVDNTLLAQSDSFPATGQRPTTGWLPAEIITDPHRLNFLPDLPAGDYRLIAGLYDPLSGQRLSILNAAGNPIADTIFITEVTLP